MLTLSVRSSSSSSVVSICHFDFGDGSCACRVPTLSSSVVRWPAIDLYRVLQVVCSKQKSNPFYKVPTYVLPSPINGTPGYDDAILLRRGATATNGSVTGSSCSSSRVDASRV